jgi:hypothetical protein
MKGHFPGLQRLISVTLANPVLADALLLDPIRALDQVPEDIVLTEQERALLVQIRGMPTIAAFAEELHFRMQERCSQQTDDSRAPTDLP